VSLRGELRPQVVIALIEQHETEHGTHRTNYKCGHNAGLVDQVEKDTPGGAPSPAAAACACVQFRVHRWSREQLLDRGRGRQG
jgi:hypothetical protein